MQKIVRDAVRALRAVADGVTDWSAPSPCAGWSARQVLEHASGDQVAWASTVVGGAKPDYDPFAPSGSDGGSEEDLVRAAEVAVARAWVTTTATVTTPLPQGELPLATAAAACAMDAVVHAWDIAKASGQPSPLTEELAAAILPAAHELVEPLRQWGAFAAAQEPQPGDTSAEQLLRYLGRDPNWRP